MRRLAIGLGVTITLLSFAIISYANGCSSYGRTYNNQYQQQYQNDTLLLLPVAPDYYYSTNDEASELLKELREIRKSLAQKEVSSGTAVPNFRLFGGESEQLNRQVAEILNRSCIGCHKPDATRPFLLLTSDRKPYKDADAQKNYKHHQRVYDAVESGEMPKDRAPLNPAEKSILKRWAERAKP